MKRIIIHWTAGTYKPNQTDLLHYHFIIDDTGNIFNGVYSVADNENCLDGIYAAHTGGGNTGSIGVAFAGMFGYVSPLQVGRFPITAKQFEAGCKKIAELCKQYKIPITPDTVLTHYEFGLKHPKSTSAGKIDITYLPHQPKFNKNQVGDFIRNKINWYFSKLPLI